MVMDSLQTVVGVVLMLAVGYVLGAKNIISTSTKADMNKLVVKILIPCTVLSGFQNDVDQSMVSEMASLAAAIALALCSITLFSYLLGIVIRVKRGNRGVFASMSSFPNSAFMGLPVVAALFGDAGSPYAIIMIVMGFVVTNPICYSIIKMDAAHMNSDTSSRISVKAILKLLCDPVIFVAAFAIILLALDVKLPQFIMLPVDLLSTLTAPLALLIAGFIISKCDKSKLKPDGYTLVAVFLRLGVSCAIMLGFAALFNISGLALDVAIIQFTLPCMVMVIAVSDLYGANSTMASKGFVYGTVLSVISLPIYAVIFVS